MHVLKERYVKKCGKDICGSELYMLVVSFCSKHNIFSRNGKNLAKCINQKKQIDVILLDFSKAFDSVPHLLLMSNQVVSVNGSQPVNLEYLKEQSHTCLISTLYKRCF
jgi:hypothetical protein